MFFGIMNGEKKRNWIKHMCNPDYGKRTGKVVPFSTNLNDLFPSSPSDCSDSSGGSSVVLRSVKKKSKPNTPKRVPSFLQSSDATPTPGPANVIPVAENLKLAINGTNDGSFTEAPTSRTPLFSRVSDAGLSRAAHVDRRLRFSEVNLVNPSPRPILPTPDKSNSEYPNKFPADNGDESDVTPLRSKSKIFPKKVPTSSPDEPLSSPDNNKAINKDDDDLSSVDLSFDDQFVVEPYQHDKSQRSRRVKSTSKTNKTTPRLHPEDIVEDKTTSSKHVHSKTSRKKSLPPTWDHESSDDAECASLSKKRRKVTKRKPKDSSKLSTSKNTQPSVENPPGLEAWFKSKQPTSETARTQTIPRRAYPKRKLREPHPVATEPTPPASTYQDASNVPFPVVDQSSIMNPHDSYSKKVPRTGPPASTPRKVKKTPEKAKTSNERTAANKSEDTIRSQSEASSLGGYGETSSVYVATPTDGERTNPGDAVSTNEEFPLVIDENHPSFAIVEDCEEPALVVEDINPPLSGKEGRRKKSRKKNSRNKDVPPSHVPEESRNLTKETKNHTKQSRNNTQNTKPTTRSKKSSNALDVTKAISSISSRSKGNPDKKSNRKPSYKELHLRSPPRLQVRRPSPKAVQLGLRRSTRARVRPLQTWFGERLEYDDNNELVGVVTSENALSPVHYSDDTTLIRATRPKKKSKPSNKPPKVQPPLDSAKQRSKKSMKKQVPVKKLPPPSPPTVDALLPVDDMTPHVVAPSSKNSLTTSGELDSTNISIMDSHGASRTVKAASLIVIPENEVPFGGAGRPWEPGDPVRFAKGISTQHFAAGTVTIAPGCEKPMSYMKKDVLVFHVTSGEVELTMGSGEAAISRGSYFMVPPGNNYMVKNLSSEEQACLAFCQLKS